MKAESRTLIVSGIGGIAVVGAAVVPVAMSGNLLDVFRFAGIAIGAAGVVLGFLLVVLGDRDRAAPSQHRGSLPPREGIVAVIALASVFFGLAYWGINHTLNDLPGNRFGPEDVGAIIGGATGLGGLIAGASVAASRLLRALGKQASDAGQGAKARQSGEADVIRARLEGQAAITKAQAEGQAAVLKAEADKTRAEADLERARAQGVWSRTQLERAQQGLPELPPLPGTPELTANPAEGGGGTDPSPNGSSPSTTAPHPDSSAPS